MDDFGDLTELDVALYRAVLAAPGASSRKLSAVVRAAAGELDKAIARLTDAGLVRPRDEGGHLAVSPMLAEATTLGAEDLELSTRRAALERRRDAIRRLIPDWNEVLGVGERQSGVEVVSEQREISSTLMHYADRCRQELLSIAPGRLPATRIDGRTRMANVYTARRGIRTRVLYERSAMRDRATRDYLRELAADGARIRLAPSLPGRSLVVDREIALLPVPTDDPGRYALAVVGEPSVLSWVVATFEQLWTGASAFGEGVRSQPHCETELDQLRAAILQLMAEGEKDEAISRKLSISVRTCRRHIAEYMAQVGATSRFQAGVIAARSGHTDGPGAR